MARLGSRPARRTTRRARRCARRPDPPGSPIGCPSAGLDRRAGRVLRALPGDGDRACTPVELRRRAGGRARPRGLGQGEEPDLVRAVGGAAALALQNERLDAQLRANVQELRASRARLVESTDAARRRIERDLHDGAQQQLVALALTLGGGVISIAPARRATAGLGDGELDGAMRELRGAGPGDPPGGPVRSRARRGARRPRPTRSSPGRDQRAAGGSPAWPVEAAVSFWSPRRSPTSPSTRARPVPASWSHGTASVGAGRRRRHRRGGRVQRHGLAGLADRVAALDGWFRGRVRASRGTTVRAGIPIAATTASPARRRRASPVGPVA